ncbi:methyl-accepting chemotaxis protein [Pseudomonas citronellolis]|uniref:methyl-accepting chemotaxis protein n=2 Tax=Pseudomonas citronellolis TaxID=53408 RepID=UPI00209D7732|nr:methyl-accepting chemotaxis protein [Pseudomonas citronellolis]MCP1642568.1 methyl-accepting chemotaxis protein [Pseudomonas citronellolis]MCP1665321.1 methyl-accepting chemotaxis protein [Pseudomonas citronellolis]MCP1696401.1 methyl-accepting chemotaxis protein [Pseudomonas citronellolis]MCP1702858.1 methyl-accepting chemotaxis protein [Pseudomonas citronellolis]MCP1797181.1 methyl-accepting chemotaxis protein [Pseudomonas citronellolis]
MLRSLSFAKKILLAASLVVIFAFACFIFFNDFRQSRAIQEDTESYLREVGSLTASNIQSWLEGRIHLVEMEAAQLADGEPTAERIQHVLEQQVLQRNFESVYLGEAASGVFTMRPYSPMPDGYDPRQRGWYKDAAAAGRLIVTEPFLDAGTKEQILAMSMPVMRNGQLVGVAAGDMKLQTITAILNSLKFDGDGYAFLVSDAGKILLHPDDAKVFKNLTEVYPHGAPQVRPGVQEVQVDGRTQLVSMTRVEGLPGVSWYVALVLDKSAAYAMLSDFRTSAVIATLVAIVAIIFLLGMLIRVLMQPLTAMGRAMQDIAQGEGDLTKRLKVDSRDEFGVLAEAFNRFVARIHESIREVAGTARQLHDVSQLVVNASNSSMANSDEQATRTNSVAAAINELGAAAQEIARNAADASHHASDASHQAGDGRQVVEQTIAAMNQLSEKISYASTHIEALNSRTVNIGQILEVIKGISEQTNLLALNAAIEAARAGEAGRGFAVVADEVRNLAHRAQESAQQIQGMIEELQVGAREAVNTMGESQRYSLESVEIANRAGQRLASVTGRISEIDAMNQSVATATEEQTAVVDSLNMDITEINTLNQEGVENLQATLRACADLENQAGRLRHLVDSFRI